MSRQTTLFTILIGLLAVAAIYPPIASTQQGDLKRGRLLARDPDVFLPKTQPSQKGGEQDEFVKTYLAEAVHLSESRRREFTAELNRLKTFEGELRPKLAAGQKQLGFDADGMRAEFSAISEALDNSQEARLILPQPITSLLNLKRGPVQVVRLRLQFSWMDLCNISTF